MKILVVFIDMVRVDHLNQYNPKAKKTLLDGVLENYGGTLYTKCYTHSPDTPRSLACLQTGLMPFFNGCDTRIKWPAFFIKEEVSTIWDHASSLGYHVNLCCNENEIRTGFFKFQDKNIALYNNIEDFMYKADFSENSLSFIGIPDWHTAIGDYKETNYAFHKGDEIVNEYFKKYLTSTFIGQFDYTIIFSDHGFQFKNEMNWMKSRLELIGDGRTKLLTFVHAKGDSHVTHDARLASITDIYATLENLLGLKDYRHGYSLLEEPKRDILHIEDHKDFKVYPEVMIKQWRVVTNQYDIRTDVYVTVDEHGNDANLNIIDTYLRTVSPKYSEYIKQIEIWKNYASIGKDSRNLYFIGLPRLSHFSHTILTIFQNVKAGIIRKFLVKII